MAELVGKMRWYPGDALTPIKQEDLNVLARKNGTNLSLQEIRGKNAREIPGGCTVEWSWEMPIEEATQSIVTIEAKDEASFRQTVRDLITAYRGPVPMWGMWGSSKPIENMINQILDEDDGW